MKDIRFNRERFSKGNSYYGSHGINAQTAQIRIEVPFEKGRGNYDIDIRKEVKRITEKTLKRNDLFVARAFALALMVETDTMKGHAPLLSYPLQTSAALPTGLNGFANQDAYAMYNGDLSLKTGQSVNYSRFPLLGFLNVPETQPVSISNGGALASAAIAPQFNLDNILYELPEEVVLAGTQDHKITVEFPANTTSDIKGATGTTAFMVFIVEGWLYEGGTNEVFKRDSKNPYANAI